MPPMGYSEYSRTEEQQTDNKEKILLMLLEGAARFTRFARMGLEKQSIQLKGENISKVLAILTELDCALDRDVGAEFVASLSDLYRYMMDRLSYANINNEKEPLEEVEQLLVKIREGFEGAAESLHDKTKVISQEPVPPKPQIQRGFSMAA
ncbi:MAG: flagellar export chaperone FliS [Candidatus Magnetomorum sp.]|nr:flagellar export chaperone FliS [Candidatus Magnetomorum sp.]